MDTRPGLIAVLVFSLLFSVNCALVAVQPAGWAALLFPFSVLLFFASLSGGILFKKLRQAFLVFAGLFMILCATAYTAEYALPVLCLDERYVTAVSGTVCQDSSSVLRIYLGEAENAWGTKASCRGQVTALPKEEALICAGSKVRLEGHFSNGLFICSRLTVTKKGPLQYIRSHLILLVTKRLSGCRMGEMLILGRMDSDGPEGRMLELAQQCGCIHVLALSGMHLNIMGGLVYKVIFYLSKKKKPARFLAILSASLFVFTAGPRPSLVRAYLSFLLFFIDYRERVFAGFFIHLALFPWSVFSLGAACGYTSVAAIVCLAPVMSGNLENYMPAPVASALGTSLAVILFNAPLQMMINGQWHPFAVIAGPAAGVVVAFQMLFCLFCAPALTGAGAGLLERIFTFFARAPKAGVAEYAVFAAICLLLAFSTQLRKALGGFIIRKNPTGGRYGKRIHG